MHIRTDFGKVIPHLVTSSASLGMAMKDGGKWFTTYHLLGRKEKYLIRARCPHIKFLRNRDNKRREIAECICIMNGDSRFSAEEVKWIGDKVAKRGYVVQIDVKAALRGRIYISRNGQLGYRIAAEKGILLSLLSCKKEKIPGLVNKFYNEEVQFPGNPKVICRDIKTAEGSFDIDEAYMKEHNLQPGIKGCGGVVKDVGYPVKGLKEKYGAEIVISKEANKIGVSDEQLTENIRMSKLNAVDMFSEFMLDRTIDGPRLGRNPVLCEDIKSLFNIVMKPDPGMFNHIKDVISGKEKLTPRDVETLFSYITAEGKVVPNFVGKKLLNNIDLFDPSIRAVVEKVFKKALIGMTQPRADGGSGFAAPMSRMKLMDPYGLARKKEVYILRYPATYLTRTTIYILGSTIFVEEALWINVYIGDFDGDLIFYFNLHVFPKGCIEKEDIKWVTELIKQHAPKSLNEDLSHLSDLEVTTRLIKQHSTIGITYNNYMIVEDGARLLGASINEIRSMRIRAVHNEIHAPIFGLKNSGEIKAPTKKELADKYGVPLKAVMYVATFFYALRGYNATLTDLIETAQKAKEGTKSYYEKGCLLYKGWKIQDVTPTCKPDIDKEVLETPIAKLGTNTKKSIKNILSKVFGRALDYVEKKQKEVHNA